MEKKSCVLNDIAKTSNEVHALRELKKVLVARSSQGQRQIKEIEQEMDVPKHECNAVIENFRMISARAEDKMDEKLTESYAAGAAAIAAAAAAAAARTNLITYDMQTQTWNSKPRLVLGVTRISVASPDGVDGACQCDKV